MEENNNTEEQVLSLIEKLRRQILIHSCLYYRMNTSFWGDRYWDKEALKLVGLQNRFPEIAKQGVFAEEFKGFDGTTGFDLPLDNPWVTKKALQLLDYHKKYVEGDK